MLGWIFLWLYVHSAFNVWLPGVFLQSLNFLILSLFLVSLKAMYGLFLDFIFYLDL